jgi:hypothetical protein
MLTIVKGCGGLIPLHQEITESMSYRATLILDVIGDDNLRLSTGPNIPGLRSLGNKNAAKGKLKNKSNNVTFERRGNRVDYWVARLPL